MASEFREPGAQRVFGRSWHHTTSQPASSTAKRKSQCVDHHLAGPAASNLPFQEKLHAPRNSSGQLCYATPSVDLKTCTKPRFLQNAGLGTGIDSSQITRECGSFLVFRAASEVEQKLGLELRRLHKSANAALAKEAGRNLLAGVVWGSSVWACSVFGLAASRACTSGVSGLPCLGVHVGLAVLRPSHGLGPTVS